VGSQLKFKERKGVKEEDLACSLAVISLGTTVFFGGSRTKIPTDAPNAHHS
jgi:hypothetical protein